jgi:trimeric autotransporter adhesin
MKNLIMLIAGITIAMLTSAQAQEGFNYQAVIRNAEGQPLQNQNVGIRISLQSPTGTLHYSETHTLNTNSLGIVNLVIGSGILENGSFADIPWESSSIFFRLEVDPTGSNGYTEVGNTLLQAVPYALYAKKASEFVSQNTGNAEDPIFVVRNNVGQIVFAVYQSGVRIFVEDNGAKSSRGGFAVGGLSGQNKQEVEYLRVTPDSVRINIMNASTGVKSSRGGFAVGGLSGQNKVLPNDLLFIAPEMARIYVDAQTSKSSRGGFAVGGLSGQNKAVESNFLFLTPENYFIGHEAGLYTSPGEADFGKYNSFIGYQSGKTNVYGRYNTFMGYQTGLNNTGSDNTFIGYKAGASSMDKGGNVYIGSKAGEFATYGEQNVFLGESAGTSNTYGKQNVFVGFQTGFSNTEGESNIFIGNSSGRTNLVGSFNTFLGYQAGFSNNANFNSIIGYQAGYYNTSGVSNVFIGYQAGINNTSGANNTYIGNQAGFSYWLSTRGTGNSNVFIGDSTGYKNSSGSDNVFIGSRVGPSNTSGNRNVYIGYKAGFRNDSYNNVLIGWQAGGNMFAGYDNVYIGQKAGYAGHGQYNVLIGCEAGAANTGGLNTYVGAYAGRIQGTGGYNAYFGLGVGWNKTSGDNNSIFGTYAGVDNVSGSHNIFLGYNAGYSETGSYRLYIASTGTTTPLIWGDLQNNRMVVSGNSSSNPNNFTFFANGTAGGKFDWNVASDSRLKTNVTSLGNALSTVMALRGVSYEWNNKEEFDSNTHIGFIAQEVREILPEVVTGSEETRYSMTYAPITALLVEAIKEQQEIINSYKQELQSLRLEIEAIKKQIEK